MLFKFITCLTLICPLCALAIPILIRWERYSVIALFNSPKFPDKLRGNNQSAPESAVVLLPGIYLSSYKLFSILHRLTAIPLRLWIQDLGTPCMLIWPNTQGERQIKNDQGFIWIFLFLQEQLLPCLYIVCHFYQIELYEYIFLAWTVNCMLSLLISEWCSNSLLGWASDYCTVEASFVVGPT